MKKISNVSTWAIVVGGLIALSFWSPSGSVDRDSKFVTVECV